VDVDYFVAHWIVVGPAARFQEIVRSRTRRV